MINFFLEKNSHVPLYKQLGDAIIEKINRDEYSSDERLPAIRVLAASLNVNNTTVVGAYRYLEQKRAVYSVRGSGTYVSQKSKIENVPFSVSEDCINFASTAINPAFFPTEEFRASFDAVLARDGAGAFALGDLKGYAPLREIFSEKFNFKFENVHIISDVNHTLNIIIEKLISPGDAVVLESPGSQNVAAMVASRGAKILQTPLGGNGLDIERVYFFAKKYKPKIFFLTPTFQTPTGLCYTEKTKTRLLELAHNLNAYIIEVDSFGDFYYGVKPTPLAATDAHDRVIYIKNFDRVLTTGLPGFMICNLNLETGGASGYIQRGLDFYLRNRDFESHSAKIRGNYSRIYRRTIAVAEKFLSPYASFIKPEGGLSLWINAKKDFSNDFLARKVLVSPGKLYSSNNETCFRLSFANVTPDDISKGIGIVASILQGNG
ncbi:MAG: PLP-dependent aminotransferase family protein [Clostridiales bacterium]|jgi:DNA-binding transcriptional MocR family regulator|nr:PLP-dependent aminotransferase family protein [Clostridiales bacterium]